MLVVVAVVAVAVVVVVQTCKTSLRSYMSKLLLGLAKTRTLTHQQSRLANRQTSRSAIPKIR